MKGKTSAMSAHAAPSLLLLSFMSPAVTNPRAYHARDNSRFTTLLMSATGKLKPTVLAVVSRIMAIAMLTHRLLSTHRRSSRKPPVSPTY